MAKIRPMVRELYIKASPSCKNCSGTGLLMEQEYERTFGYLKIKVTVCVCVRIHIKGANDAAS